MVDKLEQTQQESKDLKEPEGKRRRSKYLRSRHHCNMEANTSQVRRHKKHREKDNKSPTPTTSIATNHQMTEDHIFYNNSMGYTRRNNGNQILANLSFFFVLPILILLLIIESYALDQYETTATTISSSSNKNDARDSQSTIRSIIDMILSDGDINSFLPNFDDSSSNIKLSGAKTSKSASSSSYTTENILHGNIHHISSKRGDLYQLTTGQTGFGSFHDDEYFTNELNRNPDQDSDLEGVCDVFTNKQSLETSYWSYRWCHGVTIDQFHIDDDENEIKENILKSNYVVFNLGTYKGKHWTGADIYTGGDSCKAENKSSTTRQRSSKVIYECCTNQSDDNNNSNRKDSSQNLFKNMNERKSNSIYIRSIEEDSVCDYNVYICRPSICLKNEKDANNSTVNHSMKNHAPLFPPMPKKQIKKNKELIVKMFSHAYDSYMYNAYPAAELRPLSCKGGKFELIRLKCVTLIDTLDTILIFGNYTEFARSVERLRHQDNIKRSPKLNYRGGLFDVNEDVSLFETNIRILGGLLSAHQMALAFITENENLLIPLDQVLDEHGDVLIGPQTDTNKTHSLDKIWQYDGFLLELAEDLGKRLMPAFSSKSGIPYGTVNLRHGVPKGETPIASLAGAGTLTLEMEMLSRLTGNISYGNAAKLATRALWIRRSPLTSLLGKHINVNSGEWEEMLSGIGTNSDSFYEYLLKHYILHDDEDFWLMFVDSYKGIMKYLKIGDWYGDADMSYPNSKRHVMESLQAFWPGVQVLLGELVSAAKSLNSFFLVREELGLLPERFHYGDWKVDKSRGSGRNSLRPEILESAYFLHRSQYSSSPSTGWQWAMDFSLKTLQQLTWTSCGYATVKTVLRGGRKRDVELDDEMPSFFLSETLKYLYLAFDDDNLLHQDDGREWIFTTEAHPLHFVEKKKQPQITRKKNVLPLLEKQGPQLWTRYTTENEFSDDIEKTAKNSHFNEKVTLMDLFYSRNKPPDKIQDQDVHSMLLPGLRFLPKGRGHFLPKTCTNFYHSSLDWMHALNGNSGLEYEEVYDSKFNDNDFDQSSNPYDSHHKQKEFCSLSERNISSEQKVKSPGSVQKFYRNDVEVTRYDMGDMGQYDIILFDQGFHIQRVSSNESIEVVNVEEKNESTPTYMIRASVGNQERLVVSDTKGSSFMCELTIYLETNTKNESSKNKRDGKYTQKYKVQTIPCSPATFGPSELNNLVATNGLYLEGDLFVPDNDDIEGCSKDHISDKNTSNERAVISILRRGKCPFHDKAIIEKSKRNAKAIVVMNTEPGNLFVLHHTDKGTKDEPATVLITKDDGMKLMKNIDKLRGKTSETHKYSGMVKFVSMSSSKISRVNDGGIERLWPLLQDVNSKSLQVLTKGNWGIHAEKVEAKSGGSNWQLYVLNHAYQMMDDTSSINM